MDLQEAFGGRGPVQRVIPHAERLGAAEDPDATLAGPAKPILGLLLGLLELAHAKASGIDYKGDPAVLERIGAQIVPDAPPELSDTTANPRSST